MRRGQGRARHLGCLVIIAIAAPLTACGGGDDARPPPPAASTSSGGTQAAASRPLVVEAFFIPVCTTGPRVTAEGCARVDLDGVQVTVRDDEGGVVAEGSTGDDGTVGLDVPPGRYSVEGEPDRRAPITPPPQEAAVTGSGPVTVSLQYANPQQ